MIGEYRWQWKKPVKKILIVGTKTHGLNEQKIKEKCSLQKPEIPMLLINCLLLTLHDKQLLKNYLKTLRTSKRGRHLSIKMSHPEKLFNVLF